MKRVIVFLVFIISLQSFSQTAIPEIRFEKLKLEFVINSLEDLEQIKIEDIKEMMIDMDEYEKLELKIICHKEKTLDTIASNFSTTITTDRNDIESYIEQIKNLKEIITKLYKK